MKSSQLCYLILLLVGAGACHHPQARLLLPARNSGVKLEMDSLQTPELRTFPVRLKLTNYTRHKVVLVFDSIPTESSSVHPNRYQAKNLYLVVGRDTFFLGVQAKNKHLVFQESTATSFTCSGYFHYGVGHFDSFQQLDSVCKYGKVVYDFRPPAPPSVDLTMMGSPVDTLLLPTKLETSITQAVRVPYIRTFYQWREKRLTRK